MQLALAAGITDVDGMLDNMTSNQFCEWEAFYRINPFGAGAETDRFAIQQANTLNAPHFSTRKLRLPEEFKPAQRKKPKTMAQEQAIFDLLS